MSIGDMNPALNKTVSTVTASVLLSGGLDSAAAAVLFARQGYLVRGVFCDFGQPAHAAEKAAVERIGRWLDIETLPLAATASSSFGAGELIGRNAYLVFAAMFLAGVNEGILALGIHAGTPYYDCSPGFISRLRTLVEEHTDGRLTLVAPFLSWSKGQIHAYATDVGLPIDATYSCEKGTLPPCGSCASCRDRRQLEC